jgi:hydroxyethylthiazole kinase-like uncharacterized protein yjeF
VPEIVPVYSAAQVREAERPLLEAGVPLMARAAAALSVLAQDVIDELRRARGPARTRVLVLAGSGDNGGDALLAAAALVHADVDVLSTGARTHERGLVAARAAGAKRIGSTSLRDAASRYDVVLDGILGIGTGADPGLRGAGREAVDLLLPSVRDGRTRVIAVDLPSGLQPDDGTTADDLVLPAALTVTFGAVKAGLIRGRGPALAGDIVLVDLGLGPRLADEQPRGEASVSRIVAG